MKEPFTFGCLLAAIILGGCGECYARKKDSAIQEKSPSENVSSHVEEEIKVRFQLHFPNWHRIEQDSGFKMIMFSKDKYDLRTRFCIMIFQVSRLKEGAKDRIKLLKEAFGQQFKLLEFKEDCVLNNNRAQMIEYETTPPKDTADVCWTREYVIKKNDKFYIFQISSLVEQLKDSAFKDKLIATLESVNFINHK